MTINSVVVEYSPADFFYLNTDATPSESECKPIIENTDLDCTNPQGGDVQKCYNKELCKNRELAQKISIMQSKNSGSNEKLANTKSLYNYEYLRTFNLGIGIVGTIVYIYYNK